MGSENVLSAEQLTGFENLLSAVPVAGLAIDPYTKRYLQHIILHKKFYCRIYGQLLSLAIQNCSKRREDIILLDYGAGNAVMGLLAKYCGFGKVLINDLSTEFLQAAMRLSDAMGITPDGFIAGDIDAVKKYCSNQVPDVVVGSDVIEHIYRLEHFFQQLQLINPMLVTVMSTASNPANYFKVRRLKALQVQDEWHGGSNGVHTLFGDGSIEPFVKQREKIIKAYAIGRIDATAMAKLVTATRGLIKEDIEKAVEQYLLTTTLPVPPSHPTNTCDPITGSWSERLLSLQEYKSIYANSGFEVDFYPGFYNQYQVGIKGRMLLLLNKLVAITGLKLAPFITLVGKPKQ